MSNRTILLCCKLVVTFLLVSLVGVSFCFVPVNATYAPVSAGNMNLFGGEEDDEMFSVIQVNDGENVLAGYTKSYGAGGSDVWLVKTVTRLATFHGSENSGILLPSNTSNMPVIVSIPTMTRYLPWVEWSKTYGGTSDDGAKSLIQTTNGGYLLAGYTKSYGAGGSDMYLLKVDSSGALLWAMTYGESLDDEANCVIQCHDGGYVLAGYTSSDEESQSSWVVKTDSSGNIQWTTVCPGEAANSIVQTSDGGYLLATEHFNAFGLVKLDSFGNVEWSKTYPGPNDDAEAESVIQTSDGGYALAGWTLTNTSDAYSAWLIKTDYLGVRQWNQTYPDYGIYSIVQTSDEGYAMTGDRARLIITDSFGAVQWNKTYDSVLEDPEIFTRAYCLINPSPNTFVMPMIQDSYGPYPKELSSYLVTVTLKTTNDTTYEEDINDDEPVPYSSISTPNTTAEPVPPSSSVTPTVIAKTTEESNPAPFSSTATPNVVANQAVTLPEMLEASFTALLAIVAVAATVEAAFLLYRRFSGKTKQLQTNGNIR